MMSRRIYITSLLPYHKANYVIENEGAQATGFFSMCLQGDPLGEKMETGYLAGREEREHEGHERNGLGRRSCRLRRRVTRCTNRRTTQGGEEDLKILAITTSLIKREEHFGMGHRRQRQ